MTDAELLTQYILDCEEEDFIENPSRNHIYYIAYKMAFGVASADARLELILNGEGVGDEKD
jgi:hypothetical protein